MEYEKRKKNETSNHIERNLLIVAMIFGVLVLIWLGVLSLLPPGDAWFEPTASAMEATNSYVGTALSQTQAAQVMATGTAMP